MAGREIRASRSQANSADAAQGSPCRNRPLPNAAAWLQILAEPGIAAVNGETASFLQGVEFPSGCSPGHSIAGQVGHVLNDRDKAAGVVIPAR